jgi:hypothetical protein
MRQLQLLFSLISIMLMNNVLAKYPCDKSTQIIKQTSTISVVENYVNKLQCNGKPKHICIIYDIDNTLLTTDPNLGGDAWGNWQLSLDESNANKVTNWIKYTNHARFEGALRFFANYTPVESNTVEIVNKLQATYPSIGFTARSFDGYYSATVHQLAENKLDFSKNPIGSNNFDKKFFSLNNQRNGFKMYYNGVYYAASDSKGPDLKDFIIYQRQVTHNPHLCSAIIFVDDNQVNIDSVANALKDQAFIGVYLTALNAKNPYNWHIQLWQLGYPNSQGQKLFELIQQMNATK